MKLKISVFLPCSWRPGMWPGRGALWCWVSYSGQEWQHLRYSLVAHMKLCTIDIFLRQGLSGSSVKLALLVNVSVRRSLNGFAIFWEVWSRSDLEWKAGSGSALNWKFKSFGKAHNGAMEAWRVGRRSPNLQHFDEERDPNPQKAGSGSVLK
jgi:hypothetical protein